MPEQKIPGPPGPEQDCEAEKIRERTSRRSFIKKVFVSGAALTTTGMLAKKVSSLVPERSVQDRYLRDVLPGDRILMERRYVLMSEKEKKELIRFFVENYKRRS